MARDGGNDGVNARRPSTSPGGLRAFGLSSRLLLLTMLFVMLAEVLIFLPSIAKFRVDWLASRLEAAHLASLAAEAAPGGQVPAALRGELLRGAQVRAIAVKRSDQSLLVLPADMPTPVQGSYDLTPVQKATGLAALAARGSLIWDALAVYFSDGDQFIRVAGVASQGSSDMIAIVLPLGPLKAAMIQFGLNILTLSLVIAVIAAGFIYLTLNALLVRPITRITANMLHFSQSPEDASRIITPSLRRDEIGTTERELAHMQSELNQMLHQKSRLAALGLAVSKIGHDLRNLLSNVQLVSDRLAALPDPAVQRFAPKLIASLDRAIAFCNDSLRFGRAEEPAPRREVIPLAPLVSEVGDGLALPRARISLEVSIASDVMIDADRDQLYRVLNNMMRNSIQALEALDGGRGGTVSVAGGRLPDGTWIQLADDGPGIPERARANLFQAFHGSTRKGGTGLGLAIAQELVQAHGGRVTLEMAQHGTSFRIEIPDRQPTPA